MAVEWFDESKFGMIIHWGLYALPGRHEWVKSYERMSEAEYSRYLRRFNPDRFDPDSWARAARDAGMRYVVLTTKHHDGFCLWPSDLTDYSVAATPFGEDIVGRVVEAFRSAGLRIGFYYSLLDWHHPEFPIDGFHPERDNDEAKAASAARDASKYAEYMRGQVRELLTRYGRVDYMAFDFSYADPFFWRWSGANIWGGKSAPEWKSESLLAMVRDLQPEILVDDRLGIPGDVLTPEQYQPVAPMTKDGRPARWEAWQTFNGSWGYDRDNKDWKDSGLIIRMLIDTVSKGGNLLLNVGPTGRGYLEDGAVRRLRDVGEWMDLHERAIYGATIAPHVPPPDCRYTLRGDRLYLHIFSWPFRHLHLPALADHVDYAQFLHDGSEVKMSVIPAGARAQNTTMGGLAEGTLTLTLPTQRPEVEVPVVELFLR
jgi:alpha-L-fucosidase